MFCVFLVTRETSTLGQLINIWNEPGLTYFSSHMFSQARTTCLLDIAWLGNLAGQGAVPVAEVHISCMGTHRVTRGVLLALHGVTHVS